MFNKKLTICLFVMCIIGVHAADFSNTDKDAKVLKNDMEVHPDGSYKYEYQISNQIAAKEEGNGGLFAVGQAQWVDNTGVPVQLSYTADENGYHPEGSHVPAVPQYVIELVQWIKDHPYTGEGAYNPEKDGEGAYNPEKDG